MGKYPFNKEEELKVVGEFKAFSSRTGGGVEGMAKFPRLNTPITAKENYNLLFSHQDPAWMPCMYEQGSINPKDFPDNVARAFVAEALKADVKGGKDWFGVDWEYIEMVGGSMVPPGNPKVKDLENWEDDIVFPDLDKIDWAALKERNEKYIDRDYPLTTTLFTGFFERLISWVDFEDAALALIDEEQQEYVHAIFSKLADFYCELIGRLDDALKLDIVCLHDDWGSQRAPFFALDTAREMLVPYVKRVVDYCHSRNIWFHMHSCGKNEMVVPAYIEAGVDVWCPQPMNDIVMLSEKYGDQIAFGWSPDPLPDDATDEQVYECAKKFVDMFKGNKRILAFTRTTAGTTDRLHKYLYSITRELYNN